LVSSPPQGTYFVTADFSTVFDGDDMAFARYMVQEIGVAVIPLSPFYSESHKSMAAKHARFSFAKHDEQIDQAAEKLLKLRG
jgi:aspartate/methionine/tyrosine aminotransferase